MHLSIFNIKTLVGIIYYTFYAPRVFAYIYKIIAWLRGFLYGVRHSVSLDPNNINRLCKYMCPCCKRICTYIIDSYILTTSIYITDLVIKIIYFVVLMGIWRINVYYAAL